MPTQYNTCINRKYTKNSRLYIYYIYTIITKNFSKNQKEYHTNKQTYSKHINLEISSKLII